MNFNIITPEVLRENCLKFFKNDELTVQVWMSKYALKNLKGEYLESSPQERFRAIASELARIDKKYKPHEFTEDNYYDYLVNGIIMPGGSGLFGIANPYSISSLGNCFVTSLNNEDSYGAILKLDEELVQIAKRRGGDGMDLSSLRPALAPVSNAAGSSTGAVSFVPRYSNSAREVAQNGRRGALMLSLSVNHPDVGPFIDLKLDKKTATGANLSVRVTDEFMYAVECNGTHILRYPVDSPRDSVTGETNVIRRKVSAKDLWDKMMKAAWQSAEPGILFWDRIISESPADCYPGFKTESTNPCGEIPLSAYDSCRLLSVNLTHYVVNPFTPDAYLDMPGLRKAAEIATVMMDNVIDLELEKISAILNKIISDIEDYETKRRELNLWKKIKTSLEKGRRAGISAIGHGDMLAMLGMPYADDRSNIFCMDLQYFFALNCYATSMLLAEQRGAFPAFNAELEKNNPFLKRLFFKESELYNRMKTTGRRHIAMLTIPPSGSLSILFGNQTSGIEPAFDIVYKRKRKVVDGEPGATFTDLTGDKFIEYPVLHPGFKTWCTLNGYDTENASYEELLEIATKSPYYKSTSGTIDPLKKIEMQGLIQKYVDHSISITHNLPEDVSLGMVSKIYFAAWKAGCKGCTVYREGSRDGILNSGNSESKKSDFEYHDSPKRPRDLPCDIFYPTINGAGYIVLVGLFDSKPFEVFALKSTGHQMGFKGFLRKQKSKHYNLLAEDKTLLVDNIGITFDFPEWNAVTRLISWGLRHGGDITFAVDQLNKSEGVITDVSKVLARTLKKYVKPTKKDSICPECGGEMRNEGGCSTCHDCGWSKCS